MKDILRPELLRFDGKHKALLEDLCDELPPDDAVASALVDLATDDEPKVQMAATWMLRRHLQHGFEPNDETMARLAAALASVTDPWARLHVCQSIAELDVPASCVDAFLAFVRGGIAAEQKFLRAWAYDGLYHLARQHPHLADEANERLRRGAEDEAASVRARIRNLPRA